MTVQLAMSITLKKPLHRVDEMIGKIFKKKGKNKNRRSSHRSQRPSSLFRI